LKELTERQQQIVDLREQGLGWKAIAKRLSIHESTVRGVAKAAYRKVDDYDNREGVKPALPPTEKPDEPTVDETRVLFGHFAQKILRSIRVEDINDAKLKDKVLAAAIATDKWQLLSNRPTQIVSTEERRKLDVLVKVVLEEASRRGLEIDVTPTGEPVLLEAETPR
jgi:hypothetical protein